MVTVVRQMVYTSLFMGWTGRLNDMLRGVKNMRVLVACEFSGIVREAFKSRGHYAMSCDLLPTELAGNHYQGDIRNVLYDGWDVMIAHPPMHSPSSIGG
jgi:hypothetical protein